MKTKVKKQKKQAVAIAEDVLVRLRIRKLKLKSGDYIRPKARFPLTGSLQEQIDKAEANCKVCGISALLLSAARLYNKVECENIVRFHKGIGFNGIANILEPYFDELQLSVIELAFEGELINPTPLEELYDESWHQYEDEEDEKNNAMIVAVVKKGEAFHDTAIKRLKKKLGRTPSEKQASEVVLVAICRNIVKNQGEFVL